MNSGQKLIMHTTKIQAVLRFSEVRLPQAEKVNILYLFIKTTLTNRLALRSKKSHFHQSAFTNLAKLNLYDVHHSLMHRSK